MYLFHYGIQNILIKLEILDKCNLFRYYLLLIVNYL